MSISQGFGIKCLKRSLGLFFFLLICVSQKRSLDTFKVLGNVESDEAAIKDNATTMQREVSQTKLSSIFLQNQHIGTVLLLCPNGDCDIVKPAAEIDSVSLKCPSINGPIVIRKGLVFNLFVSGHRGHTNIRRFEAVSPEGPWQEAHLEIPSFDRCSPGLHSPDVIHFNGTYYMFAHGHACRGVQSRNQPTIALISNDLVHWKFPTQTYAAKEYFYTRVFFHNNVFYATAKSEEDAVGSMVLLRSESPLGPFQYVNTLARGVRHVSLHRKGGILFVFFTLIGDMPERILLGTINLDGADMRLRPGPFILEPRHDGNNLLPSEAGAAPCTNAAPQLRDPFFVPDSNEGEAELRGILYFADRELTIGAARLHINLTEYFNAVQYRNHTLVDDLVYQSSSLSVQENASERPLLITGVGRSGTTFVCDYLNQLGWNISHDNDCDCGPFPGTFGASSWYHAFKLWRVIGKVHPLRAKQVVHLIRDPLATVKSRLARSLAFPVNVDFVHGVASAWEDTRNISLGNDTMFASFSLRHWVHRNSFVSKHAQWRVKLEDLDSDPVHTWMLCLEVGRDDCSRLEVIRPILESMNKSKNSNGKLQNANEDDMNWWRRLADVDEDTVRIALKMASEYGYTLEEGVEKTFRVPTVKYTCQFRNDEAARSGLELPRQWGCYLITQ